MPRDWLVVASRAYLEDRTPRIARALLSYGWQAGIKRAELLGLPTSLVHRREPCLIVEPHPGPWLVWVLNAACAVDPYAPEAELRGGVLDALVHVSNGDDAILDTVFRLAGPEGLAELVNGNERAKLLFGAMHYFLSFGSEKNPLLDMTEAVP